MKKKLLLFLPLVITVAGCSIFGGDGESESKQNDNSSENASNAHNTSNQTSVNPEGEGLIPDTDEEDPENILLYDTFYNPSSNVKLRIDISDDHLREVCNNGNSDNTTRHDIYSPCKLTVDINGNIRVYEDVGIRIKGNMSRNESVTCFNENYFNGRAHFKLSFNETFEDSSYTPSTPLETLKNRRFGKAKKFNLKWNRNLDEGFTRESYASYIMEREGLLAQKCNNVQLTVATDHSTNTYTYSVQENIDAQFLAKRLAKASSEGDLYKGGWVNYDALTFTSSASNLFGVEDCTQNKFFVYDLKTNKKNSNMSNIKNLINAMKTNDHDASQKQLKDKLNQYIDVDYLLKFMAMEWVIGNPDSLRYHYNNTYFYFSSSNGKMYPIMFDNDRCLGIDADWISPIRYPSTTKTTMNDNMSTTQVNPLYWRTILKDSYEYPVVTEYRNKYFDYVEEYATKYLNNNAFNTYSNKFTYKDNASGGNTSFSEYATRMINEMNSCFEAEGR